MNNDKKNFDWKVMEGKALESITVFCIVEGRRKRKFDFQIVRIKKPNQPILFIVADMLRIDSAYGAPRILLESQKIETCREYARSVIFNREESDDEEFIIELKKLGVKKTPITPPAFNNDRVNTQIGRSRQPRGKVPTQKLSGIKSWSTKKKVIAVVITLAVGWFGFNFISNKIEQAKFDKEWEELGDLNDQAQDLLDQYNKNN